MLDKEGGRAKNYRNSERGGEYEERGRKGVINENRGNGETEKGWQVWAYSDDASVVPQ